nr:MAG TPA: Protein of unknown function (DUF739) [Caudoviricetes sp.]
MSSIFLKEQTSETRKVGNKMGMYHFHKIRKEKGLELDDITKALGIKDDPIHQMSRGQITLQRLHEIDLDGRPCMGNDLLLRDVRKIVKLMELTPDQIIDVFFRENPEGWPYVDPDDPE